MRLWRRLFQFNWVTEVLSPLAIILMETFCVYPWLIFLGKWPILTVLRPALSLLSVLLLIGGSYLITRYFVSRKWELPLVQLCIVAGSLVSIFLVIRIEYGAGFRLMEKEWVFYIGRVILDSYSHPSPLLIAIPTAFYLWWRGISRGRSSLYFANIYPSFLIGMTTLVILIITWGVVAGASGLRDLTSTAGIYVAGFFFFGLIALALANLQAIQARLRQKEAIDLGFSRRWLTIIVGVIGGIVLIGTGIASVFSSQFISFLGRALTMAKDLLANVVYYIFLPIGYLVEWLVYILSWVINWLRHGKEPPKLQLTDLGNSDEIAKTSKGGLAPEVILILKWTFFALVIMAIILLITRAIVRYHTSRARDDTDEVNESLWSWAGFKADLRLFLHSIFHRFVRQAKPMEVGIPDSWEGEADRQTRLNIREIYQRLLWRGSRLQLPRQRHETPDEYARRIGRFIPDGSEQINELTGLYVQVRYGEVNVEENQVDAANRLWRYLTGLFTRLENGQTGDNLRP